jgi:hypothetical protein
MHLGEQTGTPALARSIAAPGARRLRADGGEMVLFVEETGELDASSLPPGQQVRVGDRWAVATAQRPAVIVVDVGDSVLTAVARDLTAAVEVLERHLGEGGRGTAERARDACEGLVGSFSLTG